MQLQGLTGRQGACIHQGALRLSFNGAATRLAVARENPAILNRFSAIPGVRGRPRTLYTKSADHFAANG